MYRVLRDNQFTVISQGARPYSAAPWDALTRFGGFFDGSAVRTEEEIKGGFLLCGNIPILICQPLVSCLVVFFVFMFLHYPVLPPYLAAAFDAELFGVAPAEVKAAGGRGFMAMLLGL